MNVIFIDPNGDKAIDDDLVKILMDAVWRKMLHDQETVFCGQDIDAHISSMV